MAIVSRAESSRRDLVAALVQQARSAATRAVLLHTVIAERLGLNPSDHKCADLLLAESGISTPGRLAELTGLSTGAITGVIDRLERAGFVVREADPEDRRRTLVRLTPEHAPDMHELFAPFRSGMARLCASYTTEQLQLILRFMRESEEMAVQATKEVRKKTEKLR